ncbi:hypothetical protein J2W17_003408 [Pseudomonas lini]|nr:hypothetical protein [Pseudomonas lini]
MFARDVVSLPQIRFSQRTNLLPNAPAWRKTMLK